MKLLIVFAVVALASAVYFDPTYQVNMTLSGSNSWYGQNLTIDFFKDGYNATEHKWYGVGFGTQMKGTDMVICSRDNSTDFYCSQYYAEGRKRPVEVLPNNVTTVYGNLTDHVRDTFEVVIPYNSSLGTNFPVVWAYGDYRDGIMYHGKNQRGVANMTIGYNSTDDWSLLYKPWKFLPF